jgi:hypothetical protein
LELIVIAMFTLHPVAGRRFMEIGTWLFFFASRAGVLLQIVARSLDGHVAAPPPAGPSPKRGSRPRSMIACRQAGSRHAGRVISPISLAKWGLAALFAGMAPGCEPALNWRTVSLPGTELEGALPCRPGRYERPVRLGATEATMFLLSCEAQGATFGLSSADVGDVSHVEPALAGLLVAAQGAIRGTGTVEAWQPAGATPFNGNASAHYRGMRPDGVPVDEIIQVFGRGTRIYEAIVVGRRLDVAMTQPFRDALRLRLPG